MGAAKMPRSLRGNATIQITNETTDYLGRKVSAVASLIAVASFYDMFETTPVGANDVYVCTNISCSLRGGDRILAEMQQAATPDVNVRAFECLGACDIAPMASVNGTYIGPLEPGDPQRIVDALSAGEDPLPDKQILKRPLAENA